MKTILSVILLSGLWLGMACISLPAPPVSIDEAIASGLVEAKVHGIDMNDFSDIQVATEKNLEIELTNLSSGPISVRMPAGYLLTSEEDPFQNMVTPESRLFALAPNDKRAYAFIGKCIQLHDMGPGEGTYYKLSGMAGGKLQKLAEYVDQNALASSYTTQQAFWVISDNNPIWFVSEEKELQKYVSLLTGKPITEPPSGTRPAPPPVIRSWTLKGSLEFGLNETSSVSLLIKDQAGTVMKTFADNVMKNPGKHTFRYTWTGKEGKYKAQLIVNGKVKGEYPFELKDPN